MPFVELCGGSCFNNDANYLINTIIIEHGCGCIIYVANLVL